MLGWLGFVLGWLGFVLGLCWVCVGLGGVCVGLGWVCVGLGWVCAGLVGVHFGLVGVCVGWGGVPVKSAKFFLIPLCCRISKAKCSCWGSKPMRALTQMSCHSSGIQALYFRRWLVYRRRNLVKSLLICMMTEHIMSSRPPNCKCFISMKHSQF